MFEWQTCVNFLNETCKINNNQIDISGVNNLILIQN